MVPNVDWWSMRGSLPSKSCPSVVWTLYKRKKRLEMRENRKEKRDKK